MTGMIRNYYQKCQLFLGIDLVPKHQNTNVPKHRLNQETQVSSSNSSSNSQAPKHNHKPDNRQGIGLFDMFYGLKYTFLNLKP